MQNVELKVEGMTCSNCALSVTKYLEKNDLKNVKVSPISGAVTFTADEDFSLPKITTGISGLGYKVVDDSTDQSKKTFKFLSTNKQRFLFTLPFTAVLWLHMLHGFVPLHWLMDPWVQMAICIPVFLVGMYFFGRSAIKSIFNGVPNMDVLVSIGALAAFIYSLYGAIEGLGDDYLFFETSATIITLVFFGNYLEHRSVEATQKSLKQLVKTQKVVANMIAYDDEHQEQVFPIDNSELKPGDLVLIKTGEQVPADCKILWGEARINEAIITGESTPVEKNSKDTIIGGSIVEEGVLRAQVIASGKGTVLSSIIKMVENAQGEKPPVQKLADKISAVFVPAVIGIAVVTFFMNFSLFDLSVGASLMRSIAVLVISCPCAMGIATPAAIAVGLGRAARAGILFRNAAGLEDFKNIKQVVFDKTGTLTTGKFSILGFHAVIEEIQFKNIVFALENHSAHPIASAITKNWKTKDAFRFKKVEEIKGKGMKAVDADGQIFKLGSAAFTNQDVTDDKEHNLYLVNGNELLGWVDVGDEIRAESKDIITFFKEQGVQTILLTGDNPAKAKIVADTLGIDIVFSGQSPEEKLKKVEELTATQPTAMVGDGINDAPALAKATIGISLSDASQLAVQTADVILVNGGLSNLPKALSLGRATYTTIKQNLFWAFAYNVIAIPVAALGYLTPAFAALSMGLSDVVLALNSLRLFVKKIN